jgi:diguanylate cyclase (GGDEF)-like protein
MTEPTLLPMMWLVAMQFLIYAIGWLLSSVLLKDQRVAVAHWGAFMAVMGLGFVLTTMRGEPRLWWHHNGSSLVFMLGQVLMRRGIECFLGVPPRDREHAAFLAVATVCFVGIPNDVAHAPWRVLCSYALGALIMARTAITLRAPTRQAHGSLTAWLVLLPALLMVSLSGLRAVQQALSMDHPLELQLAQGANIGLMLGYLVGAALFNFSFLTLVMLRLVQRLQGLSMQDALTGLPNRRALEQALQREWQRWQRSARAFAVVALDLDHFKRINDTHGHLVGDDLLAAVGRRLAGAVRQMDIVARTGGEEFLVLMPDIDDAAADAAAERLRAALANSPLAVGPLTLPITTSLGVARVRAGDTELRQVLARADRALYAAKAAGRNRVGRDDAGLRDAA